jgi:hypothetical protein
LNSKKQAIKQFCGKEIAFPMMFMRHDFCYASFIQRLHSILFSQFKNHRQEANSMKVGYGLDRTIRGRTQFKTKAYRSFLR